MSVFVAAVLFIGGSILYGIVGVLVGQGSSAIMSPRAITTCSFPCF
jgi:hypothetical protein